MARKRTEALSRRERQIMDVLYARGEASAAEVLRGISEAPGYSAVRPILRVLEEKGHVKHRQEGPRYIYKPTLSKTKARESALQRVLHIFFGDSTGKNGRRITGFAVFEALQGRV